MGSRAAISNLSIKLQAAYPITYVCILYLPPTTMRVHIKRIGLTFTVLFFI